MLSNAYLLAKFRFDTAENEPAKKLQKFADKNWQIANLANYFANFGIAKFCYNAAQAGPREKQYTLNDDNWQDPPILTFPKPLSKLIQSY